VALNVADGHCSQAPLDFHYIKDSVVIEAASAGF
jgi:hypothetical protein